MHFKYDRSNYPKTPVFVKKTDNAGREYFTGYSNTEGFSCVSLGKKGEKNYVYSGNVKISYRKGDSQFGDEIIFELLVDSSKKVQETQKNTKYESIEIYMQFKQAIKFLEDTLKYFKSQEEK